MQSVALQPAGKARLQDPCARPEAGRLVAMEDSVCPAACCGHMCLLEPDGHLIGQASNLLMRCDFDLTKLQLPYGRLF